MPNIIRLILGLFKNKPYICSMISGHDLKKLNLIMGSISVIVFVIFLIWTIIIWGEPKSFFTGLAASIGLIMFMYCFGDISNDDYDGYYF